MSIDRILFRVRRHDSTPVFTLRRVLRVFFRPTFPRVPRLIAPLLRLVYEGYWICIVFGRFVMAALFRNPLFQSRCARFGKRVCVEGLPFVSGHVRIEIGDDVTIGGKVFIASGAVFEEPKFIMKDRSAIGWNTVIAVNREVVIEEDAIVSYDCRISDSDGHRREADLRACGARPDPKDIRPVRICRHAWIGNGTHVMKGVTIGEGAVIGANSVVISNIPPYCLAMGNPAEVFIRNYGRPAEERSQSQAQAE